MRVADLKEAGGSEVGGSLPVVKKSAVKKSEFPSQLRSRRARMVL